MTERVNLGVKDDPWIAGDDRELVVTALTEDGSPYNFDTVTGAEFVMAEDHNEPVLELSLGNGIVKSGTTLTISITDTQSALFDGKYNYRVTVTEPGGITATLLIGKIVWTRI